MSLNSSRASRVTAAGLRGPGRVASRRTSGRRLVASAALLASGLLVMTGCGMEVQTNQPYTPAEGVNVDVTNTGNANEVVHVRNLGIISRGVGEGILSGTLVGSGPDALTGVTGAATKLDGAKGSALTATLASPVELGAETLVVLTSVTPLITFESPDLTPGLTAELTLQFRTAGEVTVQVPVLNGEAPQYQTITPVPTPSAAASSATPSPSPSE